MGTLQLQNNFIQIQRCLNETLFKYARILNRTSAQSIQLTLKIWIVALLVQQQYLRAQSVRDLLELLHNNCVRDRSILIFEPFYPLSQMGV